MKIYILITKLQELAPGMLYIGQSSYTPKNQEAVVTWRRGWLIVALSDSVYAYSWRSFENMPPTYQLLTHMILFLTLFHALCNKKSQVSLGLWTRQPRQTSIKGRRKDFHFIDYTCAQLTFTILRYLQPTQGQKVSVSANQSVTAQHSKVQNQLTIGLLRSRASPQRGSARLIVRIHIRLGAPILEVRVVLHARGGARSGGAVLSRAAVGRVGLVAVQVGETSGFAADWETGRVVGTFESSRAVWPEVSSAFGDWAADVVRDAHRQVVPIDQAHYYALG